MDKGSVLTSTGWCRTFRALTSDPLGLGVVHEEGDLLALIPFEDILQFPWRRDLLARLLAGSVLDAYEVVEEGFKETIGRRVLRDLQHVKSDLRQSRRGRRCRLSHGG